MCPRLRFFPPKQLILKVQQKELQTLPPSPNVTSADISICAHRSHSWERGTFKMWVQKKKKSQQFYSPPSMCPFVLPTRLIVSILSVEFTEPRAAQISADQIKYLPPRPHPSFIIFMILSVFPLAASSFILSPLSCCLLHLFSLFILAAVPVITPSPFILLSPLPQYPFLLPLPPSFRSPLLPILRPPLPAFLSFPHRPPTSSQSSSIISSCNHLCFSISSTKIHFDLSLHLSFFLCSLHITRPAAGLLEPGRCGPVATVGWEGVCPATHHQHLLPDERQSLAAAHQGGLPLPLAPLRYPPPPSHFSKGMLWRSARLKLPLTFNAKNFALTGDFNFYI